MKRSKLQVIVVNVAAVSIFAALIYIVVSEEQWRRRDSVDFDGRAYEIGVSVDSVDVAYTRAINKGDSSTQYRIESLLPITLDLEEDFMVTQDGEPERDTELEGSSNYLAQVAHAVSGWFSRGDNSAIETREVPKGDIRALLSEEIPVDTSGDIRTLGYSGQRKIVADRTGNTYVAYRKEYGNTLQIYAAHVTGNTGQFQVKRLEQPISVPNEDEVVTQRVPSVAVDNRNVAHLTWYGSTEDEETRNRQIQYARMSGASNIWEPSRVISFVEGYDSDDSYWQEHPDILSGADNHLYVVWEGKDEEHERQQVKFSRSIDGGDSWTNWKNISAADSVSQSRPTILQDETKRLHVFMYSSDNTQSRTQQIQYAYSDDLGESWSDWRIISPDVSDARHISAAVAGGAAHVAFRSSETEDGPTRIYYMSGNGDVWNDPMQISSSNSTSYHFFPSLGVSTQGDVCVAWNQTRDSSDYPNESPDSGDIYMACGNGGVFMNPLKLTVSGSNVYPNLPMFLPDELNRIPIVYYRNKGEQPIVLRFISVL